MPSALDYAKDCREYGEALRRNAAAFAKATGLTDPQPLKQHYYEPLFYLPLGHADYLSLVLLDDFDPLHHLTARLKTTLENLTIAFEPQFNEKGQSGRDGLFCALPEMWELKRSSPLDFPPLLVYTKFKIDSLATVGLGLTFQNAIYRALIARVSEVVNRMEAELRDVGDTGASDIQASDISEMRCCLLDNQGCEEIGLLTFCNNLSLAFALVSAARCLTYRDAFNTEPNLEGMIKRSSLHEKLCFYAARSSGAGNTNNEPRSDSRALDDGHVFQWSHSSVGIVPATDLGGDSDRLFISGGKLHGRVHATSRIQISAGHFLASRNTTNPTSDHVFKENPKSGASKLEHFQYAVGIDDDRLAHNSKGFEEVHNPLVNLGVVVDNLENALKKMCYSGKLGGTRGRDIFEIETDLVVPVPRLKDANGLDLVFREVKNTHASPLEAVLPCLAERLFYSCDTPKADLEEAKNQGKARAGRLNLARLRNAQRQIGIPVSLRRTIEYLFQNYAILTADPFTFDIALDLYDAFATLHSVITDHLPKASTNLARATGLDANGRVLIDEKRVESLAMFADALHNALAHRTANGFRDVASRDTGVDFRGGLNQILLAIDAPVKCGLGVLRKFATAGKERKSRDAIGCVMQIGKMPGARCFKVRLGVEDTARLGYFEIDVPHVLHPASYADYLHEAFHLLYDSVVQGDPILNEVPGLAEIQIADRLEEIFALSLWKLFVFGDDDDSFNFHSMLSYSRDISSAGASDKETARRFIEVSLRLFFAIDAFRGLKGDPRTWSIKSDDYTDRKKGAVKDRFLEYIRRVGPFFSEYQRLWEGRTTLFAERHFYAVYSQIEGGLLPILRQALNLYQRADKSLWNDLNQGQIECVEADLKQQIIKALEEGRPMIWHSFRSDILTQNSAPLEDTNLRQSFLDPLPFVCKILRQYIETVKKAEGKEIHLIRGGEVSQFDYSNSKNWHTFQSDKGAAGLFSSCPVSREIRLRKQITIIKSFWDLASELRARRLLEMLESNAL